MILPHSFSGKTVAILGLGRSGLATAKACLRGGAEVLAWDDQEKIRLQMTEAGLTLTDLSKVNWEDVDIFILSPGIPHCFPTPHPIVAQAQAAGVSPLSDINLLYSTQPKAKYIGITGTNGKSTTTALIGHILQTNKIPTEVGGNIGFPVLDLPPLGEDGTYVLELSSYQLELSPHFHPHVAVLLNITPDHLDRHGGMEGYIAAKSLIYKNMSSADTLAISVDDAPCLAIYETLKASQQLNLLPISLSQPLAEGVSVREGILYENEKALLDLRLLPRLRGIHNWQNIAAAYGALRAFGLESEAILSSFPSFPGLAHRQQEIAHHKNVLFINDSKGTNAEATSRALACYQGNPLYLLLGGVAKEGGITSLEPYFPKITHAFLFGESARIFAQSLEGKVPYTCFETLEEATVEASRLAFLNPAPEVTVLLSPACASFDQFRDFEERGETFIRYVKDIIRNTNKKVTA